MRTRTISSGRNNIKITLILKMKLLKILKHINKSKTTFSEWLFILFNLNNVIILLFTICCKKRNFFYTWSSSTTDDLIISLHFCSSASWYRCCASRSWAHSICVWGSLLGKTHTQINTHSNLRVQALKHYFHFKGLLTICKQARRFPVQGNMDAVYFTDVCACLELYYSVWVSLMCLTESSV